MKRQNEGRRIRKLKPLLIFLIGIILILLGIYRNQNSGISYSELYFQYHVNNGASVILVGIGFIVGSFLQLKGVDKNKDNSDKRSKNKK